MRRSPAESDAGERALRWKEVTTATPKLRPPATDVKSRSRIQVWGYEAAPHTRHGARPALTVHRYGIPKPAVRP